MPVTLDVITRKKLILVRQIYQRAVIQAEAKHSYVDRILALVSFDLANETVLKAVVDTLDPSKTGDNRFQAIIQQADTILANNGLPPVPDKAKIQYVHGLRNDAQHKAKYPNDIDVSDCRTYTRDFLEQLVASVWAVSFESLSLTDIVNDQKVKGYLVEAESELAKGDYREAIIKSIAALNWTFDKVKDSIVGRIPYYTKAFVITETFGEAYPSTEVFEAFQHMQELLMRSLIGLNLPDYLQYKRLSSSVIRDVSFYEDGHYSVMLGEHDADVKEAEYIVAFAINTVIQIESLVGDINKPFKL